MDTPDMPPRPPAGDPDPPRLPVDEETWIEQQRRLKKRDGSTPPLRPSDHDVTTPPPVSHDPVADHPPRLGPRPMLPEPDPELFAPRRTIPPGVHSSALDPRLDVPAKKPGAVDLEMDPLLRLEEEKRSTRGAILFAIAIPVVTLLTSAIIALVSRAHGGPLCDSGDAHWICTRTFEILFPVIPGVVSFCGLITAAFICWRRWERSLYWQPWMGIIWILMPFTILWGTGVGTMAIIGHHPYQ